MQIFKAITLSLPLLLSAQFATAQQQQQQQVQQQQQGQQQGQQQQQQQQQRGQGGFGRGGPPPPPPPTIKIPSQVKFQYVDKAYLFASYKGLTLYTSDKDVKVGHSSCEGVCSKDWAPLAAPMMANAVEDWSIITRDDGSRQWAYKSRPVYTSVLDNKPGDKLGAGGDATWHVAMAQAAPTPVAAGKMTTATTPLGDLIDNPASKAVVAKYMPALAQGGGFLDQARGQYLKSLQGFMPEVTDEVLAKIDSDLAKLK
jgi:predicted lipoprotein with Yx(FWY)xxD motif